jgi:hypothetical protein
VQRPLALLITLVVLAAVGSGAGAIGLFMRGEGDKALALFLLALLCACAAILLFPLKGAGGRRKGRSRRGRRANRFGWNSQSGYADFEGRYYQD